MAFASPIMGRRCLQLHMSGTLDHVSVHVALCRLSLRSCIATKCHSQLVLARNCFRSMKSTVTAPSETEASVALLHSKPTVRLIVDRRDAGRMMGSPTGGRWVPRHYPRRVTASAAHA